MILLGTYVFDMHFSARFIYVSISQEIVWDKSGGGVCVVMTACISSRTTHGELHDAKRRQRHIKSDGMLALERNMTSERERNET